MIPESWKPLFERAGFLEPGLDAAAWGRTSDAGTAGGSVHPDVLGQISQLMDDLHSTRLSQAEFLRGLGHDLKSPLSSILRLSASLLNGDFGELNQQQSEGLELMIQAIQNLSAQAEALYAVGEVWSGSSSQALAVDINQAIERISAVASPHVREKGVEFKVYLDPMRPMVFAWPGVVERILGNVIQNAIRYTDEGEITVAVRSRGECVLIEVSDTGIGIPEDELALIGNTRYRGSNASGIAGSGVGMVVVSHLLEGLGGSVDVTSTVGEGTMVTVALPFRPGSGSLCVEGEG